MCHVLSWKFEFLLLSSDYIILNKQHYIVQKSGNWSQKTWVLALATQPTL